MPYPRTIERILETIERVPIIGDIITYPARHPLKTFLYTTLGLIGAKHTGLINERSPVLNALATPAMNTASGLLTRVGENIGGYPLWLSGPAQIFSRATRNLLAPTTPAP